METEENDVEHCLTSEKHMIRLCNRLQTQFEGVNLLYNYFDVNGKSDELMKWALEKDVEEASNKKSNSRLPLLTITRHSCGFVQRRQSCLEAVSSTVLWKFFAPVLEPSVAAVVNYGKLLELKNPADCKWLVVQAEGIVKRLTEQIDVFPLSLRTSFLVLLKSAQKKFPDIQTKTTVIVTLFSKFIGPIILNPRKYHLVGSEADPVPISEDAEKGLFNLAKVLGSFVLGQEIKDEPCAPPARESIQKMHPQILQLFDQLVDEKMLELVRKVIQANVVVSAADKQLALSYLDAYYKEYKLMNCVGLSLDDAREEMLGYLHNASIWKLELANRKKQLFIYSGQKPNDPVYMYKLVGIFRAPLSKAYDFVYPNWNNIIERNSLVEKCFLIERLKDQISDWHIKVKGTFPLSPRDMIIRMQMRMGNNEFWYYGSSIRRPDYPPTSKAVRANMKSVTYHVYVDKNDPTLIHFNILWHLDYGKMPVFVMNSGAKSLMNTLESVREYLCPKSGSSKTNVKN